jgi:hypothetical protein
LFFGSTPLIVAFSPSLEIARLETRAEQHITTDPKILKCVLNCLFLMGMTNQKYYFFIKEIIFFKFISHNLYWRIEFILYRIEAWVYILYMTTLTRFI